jgi:hypothetical protein
MLGQTSPDPRRACGKALQQLFVGVDPPPSRERRQRRSNVGYRFHPETFVPSWSGYGSDIRVPTAGACRGWWPMTHLS